MKDKQTDYPDRALPIKEVESMVGLKISRIYELEKAGQFPKRRIFGARSARWLMSEIMDYINTRPEAA